MQPAQIIEALLFSADTPLSPDHILGLWENEAFQEYEMNMEALEDILQGLVEKYAADAHVFELKRIDGGYQFFTKRSYYPFVRLAAVQKNKKKLSRASLETLSIIAYRQPVTKTEIEFVRGVNCDYAVRKLLDAQLVELQGRADAPGRPLLYGTSPFFMEYFGLNDIRDLPKLKEISVDEEVFQAQFKVFLKDLESPADDGEDDGDPSNN